MLETQFFRGLKPDISAQVIVHNLESFAQAVEFAQRVEKSLEISTPNINSVVCKSPDASDIAELLSIATREQAKALQEVTKQLKQLRTRLIKIQNTHK